MTTYADIGSRAVAAGHPEQTQQVIATMSDALQYMSDRDRAGATRAIDELKTRVKKQGPSASPLA